MDYYHNLVTDKSWKLLQALRKTHDFILIGGWAVFLYTMALKSKDIDLVVEYEELERLKKEFEASKNDRLKKYEAKSQEIEIDIYVPYYSNPGIAAEELKKYVASVGGFKTVKPEVLAILKQKALSQRMGTPKGRKDLIDLVSLFILTDFDFSELRSISKSFGLEDLALSSKRILEKTFELPEVGLNPHQMAKVKKAILSKI